ERAHIESITVSGNIKTREYIIRRELPIEVGDVFSKAKLQEAIMNLYNTGYFDTINPMPYQGSEDLLMDLDISVVEARTADIMMGISFNGGAGFPISGQVKWGDKNFLGTGKDISVQGTISLDTGSVSVQYNEPWLFGRRWAGGFDLSYNYADKGYIAQDVDGNGIPDPYNSWADYEASNNTIPSSHYMSYQSHSISGGFSTGYTWHFPWVKRIGISGNVRSGLQYIDYDQNIYRPYSSSLIENQQTWQYYDNFSTKLTWDDRNLVYDPTKGYVISQSLTVGGILDMSIKEYMKSVSRISFYQKLFTYSINEDDRRHAAVLDISSAYSVLFEKPWKDHLIDYSDLGYRIDGMFFGRGWASVNGGKALWDSSMTIRFPIVSNVLTVDTFLDMVGFWTEDDFYEGVQLMDFRFSTGAGIRFANPAFPIGIYLVKKFRFDEENQIDWEPEPNDIEFKDLGLDLVLAFEIDLY
ncbi:MAG: BamA/TamA family outer membrane protein, partial [Spirochaetaceae bacterium]|nr:BamA/TamA family outer membrane protein [Spirochaetaceae bacterium]